MSFEKLFSEVRCIARREKVIEAVFTIVGLMTRVQLIVPF
jgi:hypothetical protein